MKVAIVGSRSFDAYYLLEEVMDSLNTKLGGITEVLCGEALGADSLGEVWAKRRNIPVSYYKPLWDTYGRRAGLIRNCEMCNDAEGVVAFWNLFSTGTAHMIDIAKQQNKLIHVEEF